jgi:hypothetical protein
VSTSISSLLTVPVEDEESFLMPLMTSNVSWPTFDDDYDKEENMEFLYGMPRCIVELGVVIT